MEDLEEIMGNTTVTTLLKEQASFWMFLAKSGWGRLLDVRNVFG
jgi:hypothetical protein